MSRDVQSSDFSLILAALRPRQVNAVWQMEADQAQTLVAGSGGRELHVLEGRLWLTRSAHDQASEDIWLKAGDSLTLDQGSAWVLEAWPQARFQLLVPPSACLAGARSRQAGLGQRLARQIRSYAGALLPA